MEKLVKILQFLRGLPLWGRCVTAVIAALLVLVLTCSCGQTVRVTVRDTPNGVSISTTQNKSDSTSTTIAISPTINYTSHEAK